jgi:hypothetical protein
MTVHASPIAGRVATDGAAIFSPMCTPGTGLF